MKPGTRLHSTAGDVSVVIVRAGGDEPLTCAGQPMLTEPPAAGATPGDAAGETLAIGKRYHDPTSGLEVLCVKGGTGPLALGGRALEIKSAKQLPASD